MNVLITYSTREISKDSSFSVSRLIYFLYEELIKNNINVYCYSWGGNSDLDNNGINLIKLPFIHKAINKFFPKYRKQYYNTTIYNKVKSKNIDLIICTTFDALKFFSSKYKDEKIVYWAHNYPNRASVDELLKYLTKKKFFMVTPSLNTYKRLWNEFSPETLPFFYKHIPNISLPNNNSNTNSIVKKTFDFEYKNRLNFIHVSGTQLNKGLHILLRTFLALKSNKEINFIYIGNKTEIKKYENITIIELPRMSYTNLIQLYNIADFGIMSSLCFEAAPLTLHEMLENRVIPIITKSGGMEEITHNTTHYVVEYPNDMDEWTTVITKCIAIDNNKVALIKENNFDSYSSTKLNITEWGNIWANFLSNIKND